MDKKEDCIYSPKILCIHIYKFLYLSIAFTLDDTAEVQKVEMKDDYIYGKIRIEKTGSETGKALAGAKFEIRNQTTGEVEGTLTTNSEGMVESDKLLLGTYGTDGIQ